MFESLKLVTYSNSGKLSQSSDVNTEEKKSFILSTMLRSFERLTPSTLSETRLLDPLRIDFTKLQNGFGLLLVASSTAQVIDVVSLRCITGFLNRVIQSAISHPQEISVNSLCLPEKEGKEAVSWAAIDKSYNENELA